MTFSHRLTLGVELFEDRLVPATYIVRSPLPAEMPTPGPALIVRGPETGRETVPAVHPPAAGTGVTAFERAARSADYFVDVGKIAVPAAVADVHPVSLFTRPVGSATDGPAPSAAGGRSSDTSGWGAWLPASAWAVDLSRATPGPPAPWRNDLPTPGSPPDALFREELAARAPAVLSSGSGLAFLVKLVHPAEDGPFGGPEWVIPAGVPAAATGLPATTTGSSFQVIPTSPELSAPERPWFVPGAGDSPGAPGGPDSSDPGSAARPEQVRPADPPPDADVVPVEADVPGGAPVAGLLGLDTARLEAGARQLLTCVSDLGVELSEELDAPPELAWLTTAVALSGGAGYLLWANRSARRPGHRLADRSGLGARASGEEYDGSVG